MRLGVLVYRLDFEESLDAIVRIDLAGYDNIGGSFTDAGEQEIFKYILLYRGDALAAMQCGTSQKP